MAGDGNSSRAWRTKIRPTFRGQGVKEQAPCWLCGQSIDYTITDITDDAVWEPDHLYPRSTHPHLAEDPGNLRHSHRGCNRTRSNKLSINGLGKRSRNWLA